MVRDEIVNAMIAAMEARLGAPVYGAALFEDAVRDALAVVEIELPKRTRFEAAFDAEFGAPVDDLDV